MAGYPSSQIRKPTSEADFEQNCVVLFKDVLQDPNVKRLGTRGQAQNGVDLIGNRNGDPKKIVGIQCKLRAGTKLTKQEVREEIDAALAYQPPLAEYFIVTTAKDDTTLDQYAQTVTQEQEVAGRRIHMRFGDGTLSKRG